MFIPKHSAAFQYLKLKKITASGCKLFLFHRLCIGINHVKSQLIIYIINRDICEIIRLLKIKGVFSPPHKCLPHADTVRHPKDLNLARFNYLISWGCRFVLLNASVLLKEVSFSETCSKLVLELQLHTLFLVLGF